MKNIFTLYVLAAVCSAAQAQNEQDVLRYCGSQMGSSARNMGLAGAMGAVGHDISTIWMNPGGLAVNRMNVFSLSAAATGFNSHTWFAGQTAADAKFKVNIPGIGLVFTSVKYKDRKPVDEGWMNVNFGITLNQTANYNQRFSYSGYTGKSSFMDYAAERANGYTTAELSDPTAVDAGSLGYQTYLCYQPATGMNTYKAMYRFAADSMPRFAQNGTVNQWGNTRELGLALGGCHSERIYVGGSIDIPFVRFGYTNNLYEQDSGGTITDFKSLHFTQTNTTAGYGFNAKFGIIYRLTQQFRLGLAFHSPTRFSLRDNYTNAVTANFDKPIGPNGQVGQQEWEASNRRGMYTYTITSPSKAIFSFAYVQDKKGLFSIDVERTANQNARIEAPDDPFDDVNQKVRKLYKPSTNVRVGGEIFDKSTFYRAGYAFYGSPFADREAYKSAPSVRQNLAAGIGFYNRRHTLDVGYAYTWGKDFYSPYTLQTGNYETAVNSITNHSLAVSFITKF